MVATCTTELDIINAGLQYLGAKRNISVADTTNSAEEMKAAFRLARDSLIRSYNWGCCIKEGTAAFIEKVVGADRPYIYALPSDCLGVISLNGMFTGYSGVETVERYNPPYKIRGNKIYTKLSPPLYLEYSFRNEDVPSYDANFCKMCALDVAIATVERITQSGSKMQALQTMRRDALADALRANALEYPARPKPTGNWLRCRSYLEWGQ